MIMRIASKSGVGIQVEGTAAEVVVVLKAFMSP